MLNTNCLYKVIGYGRSMTEKNIEFKLRQLKWIDMSVNWMHIMLRHLYDTFDNAEQVEKMSVEAIQEFSTSVYKLVYTEVSKESDVKFMKLVDKKLFYKFYNFFKTIFNNFEGISSRSLVDTRVFISPDGGLFYIHLKTDALSTINFIVNPDEELRNKVILFGFTGNKQYSSAFNNDKKKDINPMSLFKKQIVKTGVRVGIDACSTTTLESGNLALYMDDRYYRKSRLSYTLYNGISYKVINRIIKNDKYYQLAYAKKHPEYEEKARKIEILMDTDEFIKLINKEEIAEYKWIYYNFEYDILFFAVLTPEDPLHNVNGNIRFWFISLADN